MAGFIRNIVGCGIPFVTEPASAKNTERFQEENGAGEEIRTLDINLGKVALYH
jgi:hypothetical protein